MAPLNNDGDEWNDYSNGDSDYNSNHSDYGDILPFLNPPQATGSSHTVITPSKT